MDATRSRIRVASGQHSFMRVRLQNASDASAVGKQVCPVTIAPSCYDTAEAVAVLSLGQCAGLDGRAARSPAHIVLGLQLTCVSSWFAVFSPFQNARLGNL